LGAGKDGISNIKDHPFFNDIEWELLAKRKVKPPYVPNLETKTDLSNIDRMFTREPAKETPDD
jgi:hypothetical protein